MCYRISLKIWNPPPLGFLSFGESLAIAVISHEREPSDVLLESDVGNRPLAFISFPSSYHYEFFDIQYVSYGIIIILTFFGKPNSKRRQLLKYHKAHHNKVL